MIITLKGCTATAFIGGLNFFKVSKGTVSGATVTISQSTISKDAATSTSARQIAIVALNSGYETLVVTVTMGGTTVNHWYADGEVTIPANIEVTGDIKISASATAINTGGGEVVNPEEPGTGGETEKTYGTLISNPINLRGGAVDAIAVRPSFYEEIIGKKITKVNVYKTVDSKDSSKTNIQMGKIKLSSFDCDAIDAATFNNAVSNIESVQSYNVSSMDDVLDLTCDITLNDGEYLCFVVKDGHCVGYCNNRPSRLSMMYVYQDVTEPRGTSSLSQQVPITVTVLE